MAWQQSTSPLTKKRTLLNSRSLMKIASGAQLALVKFSLRSLSARVKYLVLRKQKHIQWVKLALYYFYSVGQQKSEFFQGGLYGLKMQKVENRILQKF